MENELIKEDPYFKAYGIDFIQKIKHFQDLIIKDSTESCVFKVVALEAGLGKSKYATETIDNNLYDFGNQRSFLVVKRFKEDVIEMERQLIHHNQSEGIDGIPNVLGITSDNWSKWREKPQVLKNVNVIIITHKRYVDLCLDDEMRKYFTDGREVLIIDEKVNFPIYSFSQNYYDKLRAMLPFIRLKEQFDAVCKKLLNELEKKKIEGKENQCVRVNPKINPATLKNFIELMEANLKDIKKFEKRSAIVHFLNGIKLWYSTMCIYNGGNITTFNRKHRLWGLQNNIILDASSSVDGVYKVSDDFHLIEESRIIDHSNSTFYIINFNTSKSNLFHHERNFFPEVARKIVDRHKINDQTLIVCHKDNANKIMEQLLVNGVLVTDIHISKDSIGEDNEEHQDREATKPFAINWFGNLIGKNSYSNFTQCWVIGTPNIPYEQYLMQYMIYGRKENLDNKKLEIQKGKFKNTEFRKLQVGLVASEIYQSVKRIQRNIKPSGEYFIVNSGGEVINQVLGQILGANNQKEIELDFAKKQKQRSESNHVDKFIEHLKENLPVGEHHKRQICRDLEIKHLYRVLKTDRVHGLVEHGYIKIGHYTIEKLMYW